MAVAFFARFALCLTVLLARTLASKPVASSQANSLHDVLNGCIWECNVVGSEFGIEMKVLVSEYRLITLHLKYEQQVDRKCSNKTDAYNSSNKIAELWTWLTGGNPSYGGQNMSQPSSSNNDSITWFRKSLQGLIEVGVLCSLKPAKDLNDTQPSLNDLITMELMEEFANFAPELSHSDTVLCYKLSTKNGSFACVNITTITADSIHVSWQEYGFRILVWVFGIVALCYFPTILCLFKPTEVKTKDGIKIVLHGTSPVGIRSWIANFLFSYEDSIKWKLGKSGFISLFCTGVLLLENKVIDVVLPPALLPGQTHSLETCCYLLTTCFLMISLRALMMVILGSELSFDEPCSFCYFFGGRKNIVYANNDQGFGYYDREEIIKMHLRLQPSIVMKCCKFFFVVVSFILRHVWWEMLAFLRWPPRLLVFVLSATLMFTLSCILCLIFIIIALFHSCPLTTYCDMLIYQSAHAIKTSPSKAYPFVGYFQSLVTVGTFFVLVVKISCDLLSLIRGSLMRSPNILPVTCLIIVIVFYFWKCYISYQREYNDLAIKLYEHYKAKTQGGDSEAVQGKTGGNNKAVNSTREIPKDLFVAACEALMPTRESITILLLKFILSLTVVFILFAVIMETPGTDDITKAIGTLLAILILKVGEICCSKDPQVERLDNETLDESVGSLLDEYIAFKKTENNNDGDTSAERAYQPLSKLFQTLFPIAQPLSKLFQTLFSIARLWAERENRKSTKE